MIPCPIESPEEVAARFHNRCIICKRPWYVVHEIETRGAAGQVAMILDNRVPLCLGHHDWVHSVGSNIANPILYHYRDQVLENVL